MGSDSHPRILRLSPLISGRIGYLRRSRIFRQFLSWNCKMQEDENLHSATWVSFPSYTPLSGLHWKPAYGLPVTDRSLIPIPLLQAPPCGIPGYSLLSGGRLFAGDRSRALVRVPPAQHCIFCLSTFRCRFAPVSQGTGAGYPRRFSPMRAFRQLPLPKADASQNGFHPAYALSCGIAWRNSLSL